jgi:hypothetical protein
MTIIIELADWIGTIDSSQVKYSECFFDSSFPVILSTYSFARMNGAATGQTTCSRARSILGSHSVQITIQAKQAVRSIPGSSV